MTNTKANTIMAVFITNLGKYSEGKLVGMWLNLPATLRKKHTMLLLRIMATTLMILNQSLKV